MNEKPKKALNLLRYLDNKYKDALVPVRMKFDLLKVKAADKCFIPQNSDSTMRALVDYYDKHGTRNERMEAYYYLGCAYRDLHDSPRAVRNYRTAVDLADTTDARFDWDTYAIICGQLAGLYERQFRYDDAISMQRRVLQIREGNKFEYLYAINILGAMYDNVDSVRQADYWYDKGLAIIQEKGVEENDLQFLGAFLEFYVHNRNQKNTEVCFSAIKSYPFDKWPVNACAAMGVYYESVGKSDSALFYYTYADERYGSDIYRRKSSLRNLYKFHLKRGNEHEAMRYAKLYIQYCDSVDEDQAIEQTAQADKMYQYWKDEEEQLRLERDVYRNKMLGAYGFAGFLVAVAGALGTWYVASKRMKKTADENTHLKKKQNELEEKVNSTHEQLDSIILKQKKERQRQNRMAVSHSEIVRIFKEESDKGKGFIDNEKWNILFATIDSRFPDFKDRISEIYGEIDAKYLKFLYLLKAGFNKSAAANLLGDSRSTANYWCNKLRQLGNGLSVDDFFREQGKGNREKGIGNNE